VARIRAIKPEFWLDEEIASWPHVTRLAYIGLWNEADDEGRLRANPAYLKNRLFPYEPKLDIETVLRPIVKAEKLIIYMVGAQTYGFLPKFTDHQVINHPSASKLPALTDGSRRVPGELPDDSRNDPAGKEGKGTGKGKEYPSSRDEGAFVSFWVSYPRKVGKGAALARWGRLTASDRAAAIEAVPRFAAAQNARPREDHRFCPHPATWLSERRWEDDPGEWTGSAPVSADAAKRDDAAAKRAQLEEALKAEAEDDIRRMREARAAKKAQEACGARA